MTTFEPGRTLVMIGDSITDANRAREAQDGTPESLGTGYAALAAHWIAAAHPQTPMRVFNRGIGGETIRDLAARWQTDVLALAPDFLSLMIGINDIGRQYYAGHEADHVPLDEYTATLDRLLIETRPHLRGLILMTPFFLESNREDPMRVQTEQYGMAVKDAAHKFDALFLDTQALFDHAAAHLPVESLSEDRVHLTLLGNTTLARAWLQTVGLV